MKKSTFITWWLDLDHYLSEMQKVADMANIYDLVFLRWCMMDYQLKYMLQYVFLLEGNLHLKTTFCCELEVTCCGKLEFSTMYKGRTASPSTISAIFIAQCTGKVVDIHIFNCSTLTNYFSVVFHPVFPKFCLELCELLDRSQSLFYFVPQDK